MSIHPPFIHDRVRIVDVFPLPGDARFASIDAAMEEAAYHLGALLDEAEHKSVTVSDLNEGEAA
jgi:hypothetical protein